MTEPTPTLTKRQRTIVLAVVFLDLVGAGILIPIQPFFAESLGADATRVTWLEASYAAMQLLMVPVWGRLSDRHGRRPLILWSLCTSVMGLVVLGLAQTLPMAFAGRMIAGFGNATLAIAAASLADRSAPSERAAAMGHVGGAMGLGFLVGAMIGGTLGATGLREPLLLAAGFSLAAAGLAWRLYPETSPRTEVTGPLATILSRQTLHDARAWPSFTACLGIFGFAATSTAIFQQAIPLFLERAYVGTGPEAHLQAATYTASLMVTYGLVVIAIQGFAVPILAPRWNERRLVRAGLAIVVVALVLSPLTTLWAVSWPGLLVPIVLHATGAGLSIPATFALASRAAPAHEQGRAFGLANSMVAFGRVIGPTFAGMLLEVRLDLPFLVATGLTSIAIGFAFALRPAAEGEAPA